MKSRTIGLAALILMAVSAQAQPGWNFGQLMQATLASHPLVLGKRSAQVATQAAAQSDRPRRFVSSTRTTQENGT